MVLYEGVTHLIIVHLHAHVVIRRSPLSAETGLKLSTPILSAGSFGLSCDYMLNLQRLLPPARKISDFFINFWKDNNKIKPAWETAYVYKKQSNTEDCFW